MAHEYIAAELHSSGVPLRFINRRILAIFERIAADDTIAYNLSRRGAGLNHVYSKGGSQMRSFLLSIAIASIALMFCAPALAEVTTNVSIPVSIPVFIPCAAGGAGETVTLSGDLHILTSITINSNTLHLTQHFQPQGITGVGSVTGDKYQGTGVTRADLNVNGVIFPFNTTTVNNFRIIGQGPGNNFLVHVNVHTTVNANGDVTATVDNFSLECK